MYLNRKLKINQVVRFKFSIISGNLKEYSAKEEIKIYLNFRIRFFKNFHEFLSRYFAELLWLFTRIKHKMERFKVLIIREANRWISTYSLKVYRCVSKVGVCTYTNAFH